MDQKRMTRLNELCKEVRDDTEARLKVIDTFIRDTEINLDILKRHVELRQQMDAIKLKDRAHELTERIDKMLEREDADTGEVIRLILIKSILAVDVKANNTQLIKSVVEAYRAIGSKLPIVPGDGKTPVTM